MRFRCVLMVAVLIAAAGCAGGPGAFVSGLPAARHATPHPAEPRSHLAPAFPALRGATDGEDQYLSSAAQLPGVAGVLVAAGATHPSGVWRPLFLLSHDDGKSWRSASISTAAGATVDDAISTVVTRGDQFYAFGSASGGAAVWTSDDGRSWARHQIDRTVIGRTDELADVVATKTGFVAVGTRTVPGHFAVAESWMSLDGIRWIRHLGHAAGLGGSAAGDLRMYAVASGRPGLVAVGEYEFGRDVHQQPRVWQSADGLSWQQVKLAAHLAGSANNSWFNDVWWSGTQYVAVGAGGDGANNRYAGVVAASTDATTWTAYSSGPGLVGRGQIYLASGATRHGHTISFGAQCSIACSLYGVADRPVPWQRLTVPSGDGDAVGVGETIVTARGTVLTVGSANPGHDRDARIWRSTDGAVFSTATIAPVAAERRAVYVSDIARDAHRYLVVGRSANLPVVWSSTDGRHYGGPIALSHDRSLSASVISHGPAGWLVLGSHSVGETDQAVTWTSTDGVHWRQTHAGAFGRTGLYAYSHLSAATAWHGWVVVGDRSDNGSSNQSALAARSARGTAWILARDSTHRILVGGHRVARHDLRGDVDGTRAMNDLAVVGGEMVAVGWSQAARGVGGYNAAIWRSTDAARWSLSFLPTAGAGSSSVETVVASRNTLVAYGATDTGTVNKGVIWVSRDAGRSWHAQALAGDGGARLEVNADALAATGRGFVAGGTVGRSGMARPAFWRSSTGAAWQRVPLADRRLAAPRNWRIDGIVAVGDRVIGIATRVDPTGSIPIAFSQPVP